MWKYYTLFYIVCAFNYVCEACDSGWQPFQDSCYKYFSLRKNWANAKSYCESQHAHLAIVLSVEENNFLKDLLRKSRIANGDQVWMDGDDLKTENSFEWANTGQGFEITDWYPGEPNQNGGNEDCLSFYQRYDFQWNDEHCERAFGFLCEKGPPKVTVG